MALRKHKKFFRGSRKKFFHSWKIPTILGVIVLLIIGWQALSSFGEETRQATVVSVHDGDTFRVRFSPNARKTFAVRIRDIDCFELPSKVSSKQVERQRERFHLSEQEIYQRGEEAKILAVSLFAANDNQVELKINRAERKDIYGRILAHVLSGGKDVGATLLHSPYCFSYKDPRSFSVS